MHVVYQLIYEAIFSPASVLIMGETGTGKKLIAKSIHHCGPRRHMNFIIQNCASIPNNVLDRTLFGYHKDAFQGADVTRPGLIDLADGGTLLLDNIGDMHSSLQTKLLRALQTSEILPTGARQSHKVDVRIIATSQCDLKAQAKRGFFREDLLYRLASLAIPVPPLRCRGKDIVHLARHFTTSACTLLERPACRWTAAADEKIMSYYFPGNVRELKTLVRRAVLSCEGEELFAEYLDFDKCYSDNATLSLRERMFRLERNLLIDCLRRNRGNQTTAARELGLARRTLLYRMKKLDIRSGD